MLSARPLLNAPPGSDQLTDYDHEHFATYLFLLDCSAGDMDWRDAMTQLIGDDAKTDPDKAKTMYDSHLARAQWMCRNGYRQLLRVLHQICEALARSRLEQEPVGGRNFEPRSNFRFGTCSPKAAGPTCHAFAEPRALKFGLKFALVIGPYVAFGQPGQTETATEDASLPFHRHHERDLDLRKVGAHHWIEKLLHGSAFEIGSAHTGRSTGPVKFGHGLSPS